MYIYIYMCVYIMYLYIYIHMCVYNVYIYIHLYMCIDMYLYHVHIRSIYIYNWIRLPGIPVVYGDGKSLEIRNRIGSEFAEFAAGRPIDRFCLVCRHGAPKRP